MADLKKFAEQLTGLTVLEVNELKTILKDEYGIEPAAAAAVVAGPATDAGPAEDEKSEYDVVLKDAGGQKVAVIRQLRTLLALVLVKQKLSLTAHQSLCLKRQQKKTQKAQRKSSKRLAQL